MCFYVSQKYVFRIHHAADDSMSTTVFLNFFPPVGMFKQDLLAGGPCEAGDWPDGVTPQLATNASRRMSQHGDSATIGCSHSPPFTLQLSA